MSVPNDSSQERRARFEQVFAANFRAVRAHAHRRASHGDAEDAVAETFLVAWRRLDEVPGDAKPWLFGVARRVLANQRRAAGRRAALSQRIALEAREPEPDPAPPILQALDRLSDADREALLLSAWEGLSTAEAATALGCSRTAAKVRLHRARRRLRAELERLEPEAAPVTRRLRLEETP